MRILSKRINRKINVKIVKIAQNIYYKYKKIVKIKENILLVSVLYAGGYVLVERTSYEQKKCRKKLGKAQTYLLLHKI